MKYESSKYKTIRMKHKILLIAVVLSVVGVVSLHGCTQSDGTSRQSSSLPPLVVDKDSPLLLDEPQLLDEPAVIKKVVTKAEAKNATCYVCHANYAEEPLAKIHAKGDMACSDCHGESIAHKNDENHTTPPGKMYAVSDIDGACQKCHSSHDVQPAKVVSRWKERIGDEKSEVLCKECHESHDIAAAKVVRKWQERTGQKKSEEPIICTDCHGEHRLKMRSVRY